MKRMKGGLLTALMSLAMVFTMMPMMAQPSYADDPAPAAPGIATGPDVLSVGSNTSGAATVHMAGTKWRVIGYGESTHQYPQVASSTDTMTLIAADNLKTDIKFNTDWQASDGNCYGNSNLKTEIDKLTSASGIFSYGENECIQKRDLTGDGVWIADKPDYFTDYVAGDKVEKALLWPLSTKEAYKMEENLRQASNDDWWLRSPGEMSQVAVVRSGGSLNSRGSGITNEYGVRPAFNLDLSSVIFTSAAEGGKSSEGVGAGSLKSVEPNSNNEWKLTLKSGHDNFKVENVSTTCDGKTVNIEYSGAVAKNGEYISAIVTDENDAVKYYGNLIEFADEDSTSGTARVTIEGKMESTDKLYVFNEQLNGDKKTDYASKLIEITVPTATGHIYMWEYVNDANHMGTCTICGAETTKEHTYNGDKYCAVCNARCKHSSLNDSYSHYPDIHWITCAYCGNVIEYEEHTWQDEWTADETQHWHECKVCQRKKDEENHKWDVGKVTKEATTEAEGVKTYTCEVCKAERTEAIKKLTPDPEPKPEPVPEPEQEPIVDPKPEVKPEPVPEQEAAIDQKLEVKPTTAPDDSNDVKTEKESKGVKTADESNAFLWFVLMSAAIFALISSIILRRRIMR